VQDFDEFVASIRAEYLRLKHTLGWRFLAVSKDVMCGHVDIALITLNPGGRVIVPDHSEASCESGVAYLVERWGKPPGRPPGTNKLQVQVQCLFREIAKRTQLAANGHELMARSLIGYYVPFRSPRLADLPEKAESFAFARALWRDVLQHASPRLIVCIDRKTQCELTELIPSIFKSSLRRSTKFATGWGKYTADIDEFDDGRRLLRLPHLSTFRLFKSVNCEKPIAKIMDTACQGL
jgi:hypothetical protein